MEQKVEGKKSKRQIFVRGSIALSQIAGPPFTPLSVVRCGSILQLGFSGGEGQNGTKGSTGCHKRSECLQCLLTHVLFATIENGRYHYLP
jgi:hypothetical protein